MFTNNKPPKSPKTILAGADSTRENSTGTHEEMELTQDSKEKSAQIEMQNQLLSSLPEGAFKMEKHHDCDGMFYK